MNTAELTIAEWEEISRSHYVSTEFMMEFLEEIIEKSDTQAPPSSRRIKHTCEHCEKEFTDKRNLKRHMKIHAVNKEFPCSFCSRRFYRQDKKKCTKRTAVDYKFRQKTGGEICLLKGALSKLVKGEAVQWKKWKMMDVRVPLMKI